MASIVRFFFCYCDFDDKKKGLKQSTNLHLRWTGDARKLTSDRFTVGEEDDDDDIDDVVGHLTELPRDARKDSFRLSSNFNQIQPIVK